MENKREPFESNDAWSEIQGDQVISGLKEGKTVREINEEFAKLTGLSENPSRKVVKPPKKRRSFQVRAIDDLMNLRMGSRWGCNTRG